MVADGTCLRNHHPFTLLSLKVDPIFSFLEARGTQGGPGGPRGKPGKGYPGLPGAPWLSSGSPWPFLGAPWPPKKKKWALNAEKAKQTLKLYQVSYIWGRTLQIHAI